MYVLILFSNPADLKMPWYQLAFGLAECPPVNIWYQYNEAVRYSTRRMDIRRAMYRVNKAFGGDISSAFRNNSVHGHVLWTLNGGPGFYPRDADDVAKPRTKRQPHHFGGARDDRWDPDGLRLRRYDRVAPTDQERFDMRYDSE